VGQQHNSIWIFLIRGKNQNRRRYELRLDFMISPRIVYLQNRTILKENILQVLILSALLTISAKQKEKNGGGGGNEIHMCTKLDYIYPRLLRHKYIAN
jgi:hypothetical protein